MKKGRFSAQEDRMLEDAVKKYGENFSKISALVMNNRTNIQLKEHYSTLQSRKNNKKTWTLEEDEQLIQLKKKYGCNWSKIAALLSNVSRVQARLRYGSLMRLEKRGINLKSIERDKDSDNNPTHTTVTYTTNTPWSAENREIYVKHMRIDDQLIQFFKKEKKRKEADKRKCYHADELEEDTKVLYKNLLKFNAFLNLSTLTDDFGLSEKYHELLRSVQDLIETQKHHVDEQIEKVRLKMFGPQKPLPDNERFIPPLPFGFCAPRCKKTKSKSINYSIDTSELHQTTLSFEPDKYVSPEYLGEEIVKDFEKMKKLLTASSDLHNTHVSRSIQSANSVFWMEQDHSIKKHVIFILNSYKIIFNVSYFMYLEKKLI